MTEQEWPWLVPGALTFLGKADNCSPTPAAPLPELSEPLKAAEELLEQPFRAQGDAST